MKRNVRVLFAFAGGSGHLEPLVPIARAAREAGPLNATARPAGDQISDEIAALPGSEHAASLLERLATSSRRTSAG
jgi:hypothetical protein